MQNKSLWKFGTREVVYAAIGAALYAVLGVATNFLQLPSAGNVSFRPAVAIPMFFGIAFGPIVGFIAGFLGNIISDLISGYGFWLWWDIGNGLMGFIPGLICLSITDFRSISTSRGGTGASRDAERPHDTGKKEGSRVNGTPLFVSSGRYL